jgi:hypothetical protein
VSCEPCRARLAKSPWILQVRCLSLENDDLDLQHELSALQQGSEALTMEPITQQPAKLAAIRESWL